MWKRILESIIRFVRDVMAYGFNDDKSKYDFGDILGDFATVENGSTASRSYRQGHLIVYDKKLYRVISAIGEGDSFVVDTNIKKTNVGLEAPAIMFVRKTISAQDLIDVWGNTVRAGAFKYGATNFEFSNDKLITMISAYDELGGFVTPIAFAQGFDYSTYGMVCAGYVTSTNTTNGKRFMVPFHVYNGSDTDITIANGIDVTLVFLRSTLRADLV